MSQRCNGKLCLKTSVHSRLSSFFQNLQKFFFHEGCMMKCCVNASSTSLERCTESAYCNFVKQFWNCNQMQEFMLHIGSNLFMFHLGVDIPITTPYIIFVFLTYITYMNICYAARLRLLIPLQSPCAVSTLYSW